MILNNIIILKEGTNSVTFNSLNYIINSRLENILLGLGISNIIIILLLISLLLPILFYLIIPNIINYIISYINYIIFY